MIMPELPEVESLRRSLEPLVSGRRVVSVEILRSGVARLGTSQTRRGACKPHERATPTQLLAGRVITGILRRGKQLLIVSDGPACVMVSLGMTGSLRVANAIPGALPGAGAGQKKIERHTHVLWRLSGDATMTFIDPRRFGGLWTYPSKDEAIRDCWQELGPDATAITAQQLASGFEGRQRNLKSVLMDQGVLAGLGNIYVDEALFESGLSPHTPAGRLRTAELDRLAVSIQTILQRAIDAGGSTLRDYVDASGQRGGFQAQHRVYGRSGLPCVTCGAVLQSAKVGGRMTVWCAGCQGLGSRV
jgi:formamidopyrimidine-DNA glycosylase